MAGGGAERNAGVERVKAGSRPPWMGLAAAVWVQVAAGSAYIFPLYSDAIKEALDYNQRALTMLGVGNDVGENLGLLPGVLANRIPPWATLLIGSACAFFGFGTLWLAVTKTLVMPYWVVSLLAPSRPPISFTISPLRRPGSSHFACFCFPCLLRLDNLSDLFVWIRLDEHFVSCRVRFPANAST
jgi:hypothetical protein